MGEAACWLSTKVLPACQQKRRSKNKCFQAGTLGMNMFARLVLLGLYTNVEKNHVHAAYMAASVSACLLVSAMLSLFPLTQTFRACVSCVYSGATQHQPVNVPLLLFVHFTVA